MAGFVSVTTSSLINGLMSVLFFWSTGPSIISQQRILRHPLTTENSVQSTEPLLQASVTPVYPPNTYDQNLGFKDSLEEDSTDGGFRQQPNFRNPGFYRFPQEDIASGSDV